MESLGRGTANAMTLHTSYGCAMAVRRQMTGLAQPQADCRNTTNNNFGCRVDAPTGTFGGDLNARGGAVMALEWRAEGIRAWQFERTRVPPDVLALRSPDPSSWGPPVADFPNTDCDISSHFRNASITANIDLCGSAMANGVYESSGCALEIPPLSKPTVYLLTLPCYSGPANCINGKNCIGSAAMRNNCTDFVANNPAAFKDAFWEFGSFFVFQAA
jgi:hypothetical protein